MMMKMAQNRADAAAGWLATECLRRSNKRDNRFIGKTHLNDSFKLVNAITTFGNRMIDTTITLKVFTLLANDEENVKRSRKFELTACINW